MSIEYRLMTLADYLEVVALWAAAEGVSTSESDSEYQISKYLEHNEGGSWVAVDDEAKLIVGTVISGDDSRRGFINHLYVEPAYREAGIGAKLTSLAEEHLASRYPTKAYVFVEADNPDAITYWKKQGYSHCDSFLTLRKPLTTERFQCYSELTEADVIDYVASRGFDVDEDALVEEIGDGNMNRIFRVRSKNTSMVVKQSMPHGKIDTMVFEPTERSVYEGEYVEFYAPKLSQMIPKHIDFDTTMKVNIYRDMVGLQTLREQLSQGTVNPLVGNTIGYFLANEFLLSSSFGLGVEKKKQLENRFSNIRMRTLTEDYILRSPFDAMSTANNIDEELKPEVSRVLNNRSVCGAAKLLEWKFVSNKECLISGDFHPGNVFVGDNKKDCYFFDFDFVTWGPLAYDLGTMVGNLIISLRTNGVYLGGVGSGAESEGVAWANQNIIHVIKNIYSSLQINLGVDLPEFDSSLSRSLYHELIADSFGYAGATIAGRTYGYARFKEITGLEGRAGRVSVVGRLMDDVIYLMTECSNVDDLLKSLSDDSAF